MKKVLTPERGSAYSPHVAAATLNPNSETTMNTPAPAPARDLQTVTLVIESPYKEGCVVRHERFSTVEDALLRSKELRRKFTIPLTLQYVLGGVTYPI